ncbi:MAG: uroporphyrinogen decarboxylase [Pseudomonadota bacterium]
MTQTPLFLKTLRGESADCPPVWIMRQAGRYLPEYRQLRAKAGGFLDLCYNPEWAAEVTLQPMRRFGLDASIIFSDILVIPHGLGRKLWFETGEGPKLDPMSTAQDVAALDLSAMPEKLAPVYEAVSRVRAELHPSKALIGFCGAPWTVATYMIEGAGSKDHVATRAFAYRNPDLFSELIDILVEASVQHLQCQIAAGAQAVQVFDSWAGSLTAEGFQRWCVDPIARITSKMRALSPHIPVIGFPRGAGMHLPGFVEGTMVDAVGLDTSMSAQWAHRELPKSVPVQGNLDPALMMADVGQMRAAVLAVRKAFRGRPHILNLGHGIPQTADIAQVEALLDAAKTPLHALMESVEAAA